MRIILHNLHEIVMIAMSRKTIHELLCKQTSLRAAILAKIEYIL